MNGFDPSQGPKHEHRSSLIISTVLQKGITMEGACHKGQPLPGSGTTYNSEKKFDQHGYSQNPTTVLQPACGHTKMPIPRSSPNTVLVLVCFKRNTTTALTTCIFDTECTRVPQANPKNERPHTIVFLLHSLPVVKPLTMFLALESRGTVCATMKGTPIPTLHH